MRNADRRTEESNRIPFCILHSDFCISERPLCLSSHRGPPCGINPYSSVRVRPGAPYYQGRDVTVSISACDADCAGANPVALTISESDGPKFAGYRSKPKGWLLTVREPP